MIGNGIYDIGQQKPITIYSGTSDISQIFNFNSIPLNSNTLQCLGGSYSNAGINSRGMYSNQMSNGYLLVADSHSNLMTSNHNGIAITNTSGIISQANFNAGNNTLRSLSGGTNLTVMEPVAKSKIMKASDVISQQMSKAAPVTQAKPEIVMSAADVMKSLKS